MLFVGNSYTYENNGVDNIINGLAGSAIASKVAYENIFCKIMWKMPLL